MNSLNKSPPRQLTNISTRLASQIPTSSFAPAARSAYPAFCYGKSVHCEFYFTDVYWPEFRKVDFLRRFARSSRGHDVLGSRAGDQIGLRAALKGVSGVISATVGSEDLERQLEVVRALAPGEMEGVFGPDSLTWRIDREALTFLAPAEPFCSNWLTRGSRRPSFDTRGPSPTRSVVFIGPSR